MFGQLLQRFVRGKARPRRPTVALPHKQLAWLGFDAREVSMLLREAGMATIRFGRGGRSRRDSAAGAEWSDYLNDAVRYAVSIETESLEPENGASVSMVSAKWRAILSDTYRVTKRLFQKTPPDLIVLVHGYEPVNAVARALAIESGVPLLALENTALSGKMLWDDISGTTTNRNLAKNYYWRHRGAVSAQQAGLFERGIIERLRTLKSQEHAAPARALEVDLARPIVLFLGQVLTDASIIFGIGRWGTPLAILRELVQWCEDNRHQLVIKLHPKEATGKDPLLGRRYDRLTYRKIREDAWLWERLRHAGAIIDANNDFDTYGLIDGCAFAVTVNSQAGLETALLGKPIVVCGDSFYGGLGFTLDAPDPASLRAQLSMACSGFRPNGATEFGQIFYERYCRPKTPADLLKLIAERVR